MRVGLVVRYPDEISMQRSDSFHRWSMASFLAVGLYGILPTVAHAQSLTLSKTQTLIPVTGLTATSGSPAGEPLHLAVDPAGNVLVADWVHNTVWKVSPAGVQSTVGTGLNQPSGVALDATGDVFIADSLNSRIAKVPTTGGENTFLSGLNYPYAVTVDAAGNVFIADTNQQSVVEVPAGGGAPIRIGSGWQCPLDVAVNAAGDVFVADACLYQVVKIPARGGPQVTIGSGFVNLWGLALDSKGNVFVADSGNNRVVEVPVGGGPEFTVLSGLNFPSAVTLDAHGDLFISDRFNHRVIELSAAVPNFGKVNLCSGSACAATQTLTFNINSSVTVGSISVLTGGAAGGDFTLAGGGTCTGTLAASSTGTISTCTVNVTFAPKYPGLREGAVEILDGTGNLLGSTYVQGTGAGAEVTFGPGTPTTVGTGLQVPQAVVVDAAGNAYIADKSLGAVKAPVGGGALKPLAPGIANAAGVAVDGAGNVFVADKANGLVSEVLAVGGTQSTVVSSLSSPAGLAVDGSGNLYIADSGNNRVLEVVAAGGAQVTVGSGFSSPQGVAVDAAGDVFVADTGHNQVIEIPASGGSQITIDSGLNAPSGVAVDAAGDVYIADTGNNRIMEVPAGGGTPVVVATGSSLSGPLSVTLDAAGDLFIADSGNSRILELQTSFAPTLTYAPTGQGSTSVDSPKSVTVSNIGNTTLSLTVSVGTNFAQVAGSGLPADCSASTSTSLTAGGSCNLSISFKPTVTGPLMSAAVLTDNALGLTGATQSITLHGQGLIVPTVTFSAIATQTGGTQLTLSASTSSTSPITFSSTTPTACTVTGNIATLTRAGGSCSITATVAANSTYAGTSVTQSFTVLAVPTFTFNTVPGGTALGSAILSVTTNSTAPVVFSSTSPTVCTVAANTVNFLTSGSCQLSASVAANTVYAAASATQNVTVSLASQVITFNPIPTQTYGTTLTLSATASSNLPITYGLVQNGNCTLSNNVITFVNTGVCGVVATQSGNNVYAAATPVGQQVSVSPAAQTITFGALPNKVQGTTGAVSASASSGLAVSFTSLTPSVCTVSGTTVSTLNAGTCTIQAAQGGNSNYSAARNVTQSFTVTPAFTLTISPQGQTVLAGLFDLVTVQIQSPTGYSGIVKLGCSGGPVGSSCLAAPLPVLMVNGCGSALVTILVPLGTPSGTYTETLTVTAGSLSDSGTVTFTVVSLL